MKSFYTKLAIILSVAFINADPQSILDYLNSLPQKSEQRVLSGQFIGWLQQEDTNVFNRIHKITGQYPAIMSSNYADFGKDIFEFQSTNALLIDHWKHGGLVEVGIHFDNPVNNKWDVNTNVDLVRLVHRGDDINTNFNIQLDRIAIGLEELQKVGIVVLFRPLMEPNGWWFWYGRKDQNEYINVWKYVFNYLTKDKNLHNLIWIYSVSANYGGALLYYPGDNFVDIVGLDYYSYDGKFVATEEYRQFLTTGKPVVLSEIGQCMSSGYNCYPKDSIKIIQSIKEEMPEIVYYSNWNDVWAMDKHFNLAKTLTDPWIVNRGMINNGH